MKPTKTFAQAKNEKLDIILIPGGGQPWAVGQEVKNFVKWGAEHVEHVLTGELNLEARLIQCVPARGFSPLLAASTVRKRPPTSYCSDNVRYFPFKRVHPDLQEQTAAYKVEWITKARFVQSGKFWTASGVSAGTDMACAFAREICGEKAILYAQEFAEYT